jgi:hypothetical protein
MNVSPFMRSAAGSRGCNPRCESLPCSPYLRFLHRKPGFCDHCFADAHGGMDVAARTRARLFSHVRPRLGCHALAEDVEAERPRLVRIALSVANECPRWASSRVWVRKLCCCVPIHAVPLSLRANYSVGKSFAMSHLVTPFALPFLSTLAAHPVALLFATIAHPLS